ncbi:MAG: metalloregulator ArsR/SmtB family transcription factor [Anaerolineae bacterium]|nr:metalloregulator ArsR/SmtB family transcription factor [Anaerolineae bacterium]
MSANETLNTLKALADESRLTLLRLLNQGEQTVGDLAAKVELTEPTVSHHLSRLRGAGLLTLRMAGNQRYYRINRDGLAKFKRAMAEIEQMPPEPDVSASDDSWIDALGWDSEDLQVLRTHTADGHLTSIPTKRKKLLVILRWVATLFEPDKMYSETDVNVIIRQVYEEDYVTLRRELIDMGYLRRERGGGQYWLAPADEKVV